jgi:hypothetical protein
VASPLAKKGRFGRFNNTVFTSGAPEKRRMRLDNQNRLVQV